MVFINAAEVRLFLTGADSAKAFIRAFGACLLAT
jgi:hypothetical protein